ncbi:uncharacterized protein LOC111015690 isoform X3 [Momordica charantia]|uniref:Uncharacterized protein LOC111015690 isoform X3 n=1 Tax=Momordica charantia TaxID=3673 RepID=A0A6J1CXE3_MOMCH|nr:uncharacterized protein LOC111015690 isoform X3 [Momordica charantia]
MDVLASRTQFSNCFCCQQICTIYTLKRFCIFLLFIAIFSVIAVLIAALPVILLLKPREPIFSLQSLRLDCPSRLLVIYDGNAVIGTIRVPEVFQPARSDDRSVRTRLLLHRFNVDLFDATRELAEIKVVGDVGVELLVLHMAVLKMKVALNCDVIVNYRELNFRNEVLDNGSGTIKKALFSGFIWFQLPDNVHKLWHRFLLMKEIKQRTQIS